MAPQKTSPAAERPAAERPVAGVQFPVSGSDSSPGSRSTADFARSVLQASLSGVDDAAAAAVAIEKNWRAGYLPHFRALVGSGLGSSLDATTIAAQGLAAVADQMQWVNSDGTSQPLSQLGADGGFGTLELGGEGTPVAELVIPFNGTQLRGTALIDQLDAWVQAGSMEPSAAESLKQVAAHPEWLSLPGRTLMALGAGAEIGPIGVFLNWGATVAAVDLPRPAIWERLTETASASAGTLLAPIRDRAGDAAGDPDTLGVDLLTELPQLMGWLNQVAASEELGAPVLGNFLYADGGTNVRVAAAGHALAQHLTRQRPETALGFLATPTDVFVVPDAAVAVSHQRWAQRPAWSKVVGGALAGVSGKRLIQPNYRGATTPEMVDSLVPQQGPNYALGKRIHRWQATAQWAQGRPVSMNVAPATRTRSVMKNKALAAAYVGAHHYGVEVFAPDTTRVVMAALLVHDLYGTTPTFAHPWELEAHQATHGGLWRTAYTPRSALTLAAVLGAPGLLRR